MNQAFGFLQYFCHIHVMFQSRRLLPHLPHLVGKILRRDLIADNKPNEAERA